MKKLFPYIIPSLIIAFLITFSENPIRARLINPPATERLTSSSTNVSVSYSSDNKNWMTINITDADLASAIYNPNTGQKELYMTVELPNDAQYTSSYIKAFATKTITSLNRNGTYRISNQLIPYSLSTIPTLNGIVLYGGMPQPDIACLGLIVILVAVAVVLGVIIYIFYTVCQSLNKPVHNQQNDDD